MTNIFSMTAIEQLQDCLRPNPVNPSVADVSGIATACAKHLEALQKNNAEMEKRIRGAVVNDIPDDQIRAALARFQKKPYFEDFRQAIRVCVGLVMPLTENGPNIMDTKMLPKALAECDEAWLSPPRYYRSCYSGLMHSYFSCDPEPENGPTNNDVRRENWRTLRDYLRKNNGKIIEQGKINPDWAHCAQEHSRLFGDNPCAWYAEAIVQGQNTESVLKPLREQLQVSALSWFYRQLVLGQIQVAVDKPDNEFVALLPKMLDLLLETNKLLRDRGFIQLLQRYAQIPSAPLHQELRDKAVAWWGNPWLPSTATRWGGVTKEAREMVADWLKREFIESFFQKLAQDGVGDTRRAKFWLDYVKSMGDIRFALAAGWRDKARNDRDLRTLLEKMTGLTPGLTATNREASAFIMNLGRLVLVEFGQSGNAMYAYSSGYEPFDVKEPLSLGVNADNSLKNKTRNVFKFLHNDGLERWEDKLAAKLKEYDIHPDRNTALKPPPHNPHPPATDYSFAKLQELADQHGFSIEDKTSQGGYVWVVPRPPAATPSIEAQLRRWGFQYMRPKGWWLKP
ncbi:MAG: hypothetical protein LBU39_05025 [Desulfobulbaceae bacterium]|nr:hypothetical protein [Desulfobulbaceae bacterium]